MYPWPPLPSAAPFAVSTHTAWGAECDFRWYHFLTPPPHPGIFLIYRAIMKAGFSSTTFTYAETWTMCVCVCMWERDRERKKGKERRGKGRELSIDITRNFSLFFFFFCLSTFSRAAPEAYGGSQGRGLIGAVATGLHQSHSNEGYEPHLRRTPQLTATPDP